MQPAFILFVYLAKERLVSIIMAYKQLFFFFVWSSGDIYIAVSTTFLFVLLLSSLRGSVLMDGRKDGLLHIRLSFADVGNTSRRLPRIGLDQV